MPWCAHTPGGRIARFLRVQNNSQQGRTAVLQCVAASQHLVAHRQSVCCLCVIFVCMQPRIHSALPHPLCVEHLEQSSQLAHQCVRVCELSVSAFPRCSRPPCSMLKQRFPSTTACSPEAPVPLPRVAANTEASHHCVATLGAPLALPCPRGRPRGSMASPPRRSLSCRVHCCTSPGAEQGRRGERDGVLRCAAHEMGAPPAAGGRCLVGACTADSAALRTEPARWHCKRRCKHRWINRGRAVPATQRTAAPAIAAACASSKPPKALCYK